MLAQELPRMKPRDRALLVFGLGVLLMLNPVYAFPDGNS